MRKLRLLAVTGLHEVVEWVRQKLNGKPSLVWPAASKAKQGLLAMVPPGSGIFVFVQQGVDAPQRIELPAFGYLLVRRGLPEEKSRGQVLVLHDDRVTREKHCRIRVVSNRILIEDSSAFGTWVDGKRVHNAAEKAKAGSTIKIGDTVLVLRSKKDFPRLKANVQKT